MSEELIPMRFEFDEKSEADEFLNEVKSIAKKYLYATVVDIFYIKNRGTAVGFVNEPERYTSLIQYGISKRALMGVKPVKDKTNCKYIVVLPNPTKIGLKQDGYFRPDEEDE